MCLIDGKNLKTNERRRRAGKVETPKALVVGSVPASLAQELQLHARDMNRPQLQS